MASYRIKCYCGFDKEVSERDCLFDSLKETLTCPQCMYRLSKSVVKNSIGFREVVPLLSVSKKLK
tara:strand:+ start:91909 stop:92103 length:195 start_codon:yes stop_codon:yes gene_type:complete